MSFPVHVGDTNQMVDIFVQDNSVTTGAGLANLLISTFSSYYHLDVSSSTTPVTLVSTGTLGTYSSGQFLQINSTFMRGWYQFCLPNGMFASGSSVALHMYGAPSMAPVVMRFPIVRENPQIEISSQIPRVGVSSFGGITVGVSSVTDKAGYSVSSISVGVSTSWFSGAGIVTTAAGRLSVDVSSIIGTKVVTTAAGVQAAGPVGVSAMAIGVAVTTMSAPVSVTSLYGTALVTSAAGYAATYFDLGRILNSTSTVILSSFQISSSPVTVGAVDVSSIYGSPIVTTAAGVMSMNVSTVLGSKVVTTAAGVLGVGRVGVSSMNIGVSVTTMGTGVGVTTISAPVDVTSLYGTALVTSAAGYAATYFDLGRILNSTSTVILSSFQVSSQSVSVGSVDVSSIYGSGFVTTAAGVLAVGRVGVSSFGLPVGISSNPIGVRVTTMSIGVGVTTLSVPVDVSSVYGTALTTSAAGYVDVNISSVAGRFLSGTGTSADPWTPI